MAGQSAPALCTWMSLQDASGQPYLFGARKSPKQYPLWGLNNVIYRWLKNSTGEVAYIGETEQPLTQRVNLYVSARQHSEAGLTNKKVHREAVRLQAQGDNLRLEFTNGVVGYDLAKKAERRLAEEHLSIVYRPYLKV